MREWVPQQRFCITGGAGALGRSLITKLIEYGAKHIVVLDQHDNSFLCEEFQNTPVHFIYGSILQTAHLRKAVKHCTALFHLASLIHAGRSISEPINYIDVNCVGTLKVLEVCKEQGVPLVIYTSTSHVYGRPCMVPVNEQHATMPLSIYAASKLAGEALMHAYASSFGFSTVIARLANLYSSSPESDTVLGSALEQVATGRAIQLRNLSVVRDFLYIDDAVEALIRLAVVAKDRHASLTVNISTGRGTSIKEMCQILADAAVQQGLKRPTIMQKCDHQEEQVPTLVLDNSLLRSLTGWTPETTMEDGLAVVLRKRLRGSMVFS
jgi:UDP-glucose 4-epimerase